MAFGAIKDPRAKPKKMSTTTGGVGNSAGSTAAPPTNNNVKQAQNRDKGTLGSRMGGPSQNRPISPPAQTGARRRIRPQRDMGPYMQRRAITQPRTGGVINQDSLSQIPQRGEGVDSRIVNPQNQNFSSAGVASVQPRYTPEQERFNAEMARMKEQERLLREEMQRKWGEEQNQYGLATPIPMMRPNPMSGLNPMRDRLTWF